MRRLGRAAVRIVLCLAILFALACAAIVVAGLHDTLARADLGVVLGNAVKSNGQPSERLRVRLDQAIKLYREGYFKLILVSGATGREGYSEPRAMRHYLENAGLPSACIFEDGEGRDTYHTAQSTARFMQDHHLASVVIVSQYFHLARCRLAFARFGITTIYASHAPYFSLRDFFSVPREVAGYIEYSIRSYPALPES